MISRDTSDDFMPWWPMAMPSVTVMVQNSRGVPLAAATPFLTACAWRMSEMLQGAASFQQLATPTKGWWICSAGETHGIVVGAVRSALRPFRDMTARQPPLVDDTRVHNYPSPAPPTRGPAHRRKRTLFPGLGASPPAFRVRCFAPLGRRPD